jgi:nitrogen fixation protein FixH
MSNEYSPTEARRDPFSSGPSETHARPHQITGLIVLGFMIAFFAIIVGVNVFMAHAAISTFGGVETASSYHAGQMFERDVAMAKAQDAQHWRVDAKLTRAADGTTLIDITAHDGAGAPVSGVAASAQFARPTNRRLDRTIMVGQTGPGHFVGNTDLAAGQWDLVIELSRQGERLFRSKNRVVLK